MQSLKEFFWFCSGVDPLVLKRTPTDHQKYAGIGATVFFTGLLAFMSSAYALWTVFGSVLASVVFGIIWGLMIFNLDRYIVSSMKSRGAFGRDLLVALPRLGLAVLLAIVIAKPLEMKIFESEVNAELVSMEQEVRKAQEEKVKVRYTDDIAQIGIEIDGLKEEIEELRTRRDAAALMALQEADGTGGSMRRNLGPIYLAKQAEANQLQSELDQVEIDNGTLIVERQNSRRALEEHMQADLTSLTETPLTGLAARLDALHRLGAASNAIWYANLFIMLLFIAIECAPIFVKLISYRSPYDFVLNKHEFKFAMNHKERTSILQNAVTNRLAYDAEIGTYRRQQAILSEKKLIEHHLKEEVERLKQQPATWRDVLQGIFQI